MAHDTAHSDDPRRKLAPVHLLLEEPRAKELIAHFSRQVVLETLQQTLGKEVFRMGRREDIFTTLDATIELIRERMEDEHFLAQVVDKVGLDYIARRVFGV